MCSVLPTKGLVTVRLHLDRSRFYAQSPEKCSSAHAGHRERRHHIAMERLSCSTHARIVVKSTINRNDGKGYEVGAHAKAGNDEPTLVLTRAGTIAFNMPFVVRD